MPQDNASCGHMCDPMCIIGPRPFRAGRRVRDHAVQLPHFTVEGTEVLRAGDGNCPVACLVAVFGLKSRFSDFWSIVVYKIPPKQTRNFTGCMFMRKVFCRWLKYSLPEFFLACIAKIHKMPLPFRKTLSDGQNTP